MEINMLTAKSLFDLSDFTHSAIFKDDQYVWSALNNLKQYMDAYTYPTLDRSLIPDGKPLTEMVILHNGIFTSGADAEIDFGDATKGSLKVSRNKEVLSGASVIMAGTVIIGNQIALGQGVLIESGAMIKSPAIIGDCCEVRQAAYLRGYCLAGKRCVLGHATEIKNSIFLNDAKAGHFAYLGDSILGADANLGAGTKFANLKMVKGNVIIRHNGESIDTGRRKFGAILGDGSQTGCNSVTNPGTIFGKKCMLMPNTTSPGGYHQEKSLIR
jgi:carbonic anhydrase/acetyltransferase-like protein (isoleucine patch superfamily)